MKKLWIPAAAFLLTAALFTGCGCTNRNKPEMTTPTGITETMPTVLPTQAPTVPTTETTRPTTAPTLPPDSTVMEDPGAGTEEIPAGRSRTMPGSGSVRRESGR